MCTYSYGKYFNELHRFIIFFLLEIFISIGLNGKLSTLESLTSRSHRCSVMTDFSHLFLVLNSSVNIIIYSWRDKKFRELLLRLFHLECLFQPASSRVTAVDRNIEDFSHQLTTISSFETNNTISINSIVTSQC